MGRCGVSPEELLQAGVAEAVAAGGDADGLPHGLPAERAQHPAPRPLQQLVVVARHPAAAAAAAPRPLGSALRTRLRPEAARGGGTGPSPPRHGDGTGIATAPRPDPASPRGGDGAVPAPSRGSGSIAPGTAPPGGLGGSTWGQPPWGPGEHPSAGFGTATLGTATAGVWGASTSHHTRPPHPCSLPRAGAGLCGHTRPCPRCPCLPSLTQRCPRGATLPQAAQGHGCAPEQAGGGIQPPGLLPPQSSSCPTITYSRTWRGCPEPSMPQERGGHTLLWLCLAGNSHLRLQPTASLQPRFVTEQEPGGGRIKANLSGSSPLVTL